jgi:hypothetical protein
LGRCRNCLISGNGKAISSFGDIIFCQIKVNSWRAWRLSARKIWIPIGLMSRKGAKDAK